MSFCFNPKHEHKCPHVSHCPHLGGAALGTLVLVANEQELSRRALHATIDAERARNERLVAENERLQRELEQVKLELKLERQNKFATNQQKQNSGDSSENADSTAKAAAPATQEKKRRGAPVGHAGWYRNTPTAYDWAIDVSAPARCPQCHGHVTTDVLGEHFTGTLVTDCYAGYEAHTAGDPRESRDSAEVNSETSARVARLSGRSSRAAHEQRGRGKSRGEALIVPHI